MQTHLFNVETALITARTVVRRFREGDGAELYDLIQTNKVFLDELLRETAEGTTSREHAEFYAREKLAAWLLQTEFAFAVCDKQSAKLIGMISIFGVRWHEQDGAVGYLLDHDFGRKGLMTEVLQAIIAFGFRQLKLNKLSLRTSVENYSSQRLARKCGFRREGDLRDGFRKISGELTDVMLFGLTRVEWGEG